MKRSAQVRLALLGGASASLLSSCGDSTAEPRVTPESYYSNNHYIPGAGYYHAPFRSFFPESYNAYNPAQGKYYYNGSWQANPYQSIINVSSPTPEAATRAEALRTDIQRSGFGRTGSRHWIHS